MYKIKEVWRVMGEKEHHESDHKTLKEVKKYIQDWVSSWKESAAENEYKIESVKTDELSFARIVINKNTNYVFQKGYEWLETPASHKKDIFNLKVIKV